MIPAPKVGHALMDFVVYVWDEACQDYMISFKDGDPQETFYDSFNSVFDCDKEFEQLVKHLVERIGELSLESKRRMSEINGLIEPRNKHVLSNKGMAFIKILRYYAKDR